MYATKNDFQLAIFSLHLSFISIIQDLYLIRVVFALYSLVNVNSVVRHFNLLPSLAERLELECWRRLAVARDALQAVVILN